MAQFEFNTTSKMLKIEGSSSPIKAVNAANIRVIKKTASRAVTFIQFDDFEKILVKTDDTLKIDEGAAGITTVDEIISAISAPPDRGERTVVETPETPKRKGKESTKDETQTP